jgi:predicted RNase H-like nuclease
MTFVLGVDGCPGGWCCAAIDAERRAVSEAFIRPSFDKVLESAADLICVDIPIGLLNTPGQRACDVEARRLLGGGRGPSVFPPPSRRALAFDEYARASTVNFELTGRYLNRQAFNIAPKIREVDEAMKAGVQERVREVHPEVAFMVLNGGRAMRLSKKTAAGRQVRWRLLRGVIEGLTANPSLPPELKGRCGTDDYIDALACAWTAVCVARGTAVRIPEAPPVDERGLRMEIWIPG